MPFCNASKKVEVGEYLGISRLDHSNDCLYKMASELHRVSQDIVSVETEAHFMPHCDNDSCDLGEFRYTCPTCGKVSLDGDIWWKQNDLYRGEIHKFECKKCKNTLSVKCEQGIFLIQNNTD